MCCFSGSPGTVTYVGQTSLFARAAGDRQRLAYSMSVAATEPVAMILPLPVPPRSAEDAVRFIDLSGYPSLFHDLDATFPPIVLEAQAMRGGAGEPVRLDRQLAVHEVGSFIASFVPTLDDFARLDARFRMSDDVWRALPQYADWGFAVFKLTTLKRGWFGLGRVKTKAIHPMAFEFPRRDPSQLFFPTVHVHDGEVHPEADFDHTLYYQAPAQLRPSLDASVHQTAARPVGEVVDVARTAGLVDGAAPIHRTVLNQRLPNRDVVFTAA